MDPTAVARGLEGYKRRAVPSKALSPIRQAQTALRQLVARIRKQTPMVGASIPPVLITRSNVDQAERIGEVR